MRTLEALLWLMSASGMAWWLVRRPPRWVSQGLVAGLLLVLVLHLAVEGARFHMIPSYGLAAMVIVLALRRRTSAAARPRWPRWARVSLSVPLAAVLAAAAALPFLFPVFAYETPGGRYAIGTATYELKGGPRGRNLVVQAWYPAEPGTSGRRAGITSRVDLQESAFASFTGLPRPLFDNLRLVRTHAVEDAVIAGSGTRFPIVLFSHGPLGANRSQSVFQMEALAGRGFVVVAIDHTGYASTTIFPDGHAVPPDPRAAWPVFVDARSTDMLETWVADVRFVIDRLQWLDDGHPDTHLKGRLDLSRIGYLGASFGGSVVVQALLEEPRIKAGVAEDGKPYFSDSTLTSLRRPLMYMQSAEPYIATSDAQLARWGLTATQFRIAEQDHYARLMQLFANAKGPIYNVYIRQTNHVTFSDLYLIIGLPDVHLMNIRRAHRIINDYSIAFFERFLNGNADRLVDGTTPSPYPEVTVASRQVAQ